MKRVLKLKSGQEYDVVEQTGKYYICADGTQFRILNPDIESVKDVKEKKEEKWVDLSDEEIVPAKEEKPNERKSRRVSTKKKGEDK